MVNQDRDRVPVTSGIEAQAACEFDGRCPGDGRVQMSGGLALDRIGEDYGASQAESDEAAWHLIGKHFATSVELYRALPGGALAE